MQEIARDSAPGPFRMPAPLRSVTSAGGYSGAAAKKKSGPARSRSRSRARPDHCCALCCNASALAFMRAARFSLSGCDENIF